jgi:hypothetical protein
MQRRAAAARGPGAGPVRSARKLTGVPARQYGDGREPPAAQAAAIRPAGRWLAAAVLLMAGAAGCAKFDAALGQQWATVNFKPNTSAATLLKVRAACSHVPNARPEALPKVRSTANMIYALTYRTDHASDADLAELQQCLQRFPVVAGIDFQDSGDAG